MLTSKVKLKKLFDKLYPAIRVYWFPKYGNYLSIIVIPRSYCSTITNKNNFLNIKKGGTR